MANFAPVAPIRILEQFSQMGIIGEYHLLLAHDIISNPLASRAYQDVFGKRQWEGTVILDNSIIELGNAVDLDVIAEAAEIVRANVIVLPDVLEDGVATVTSIDDAYDEWAERFDDLLGDNNYRFMMVPQGKTIEEFRDCAEALYQIDPGADHMWGIPRNLVKLHGSRTDAITAVHEIDPSYAIHLLGFSDTLADDIECARRQEVGGIDSAVPIRTENWRDVATGLSVAPKRGDWFEKCRYLPWMAENLQDARRTFSGYQDLVG